MGPEARHDCLRGGRRPGRAHGHGERTLRPTGRGKKERTLLVDRQMVSLGGRAIGVKGRGRPPNCGEPWDLHEGSMVDYLARNHPLKSLE